MFIFVLQLCMCLVLCFGDNETVMRYERETSNEEFNVSSPIGNFTVELLYHTAEIQQTQNLVVAPLATWTVLAAIADGARGITRRELVTGLRIPTDRKIVRQGLQDTMRWLLVNTTTIQLAKLNVIILDKSMFLERDFRQLAKTVYDTEVVELDYANIPQKGNISKLVDEGNLNKELMYLANTVYFKGQWNSPFNISYTSRQNFYDSSGTIIGNVNMMYNRHTYPFVHIHELQAKVIELPYGVENRLSMLILLPNPGVTVEKMVTNFQYAPLDTVLYNLKLSQEQNDDIDCYVPRFRIESNLDLKNVLTKGMGLVSLFDTAGADVRRIIRLGPLYVKKFIHKAEIEVTEDGITTTASTTESSNRKVKLFQANRPFSYLIIEKVTNTVIFAGVYQQPELY